MKLISAPNGYECTVGSIEMFKQQVGEALPGDNVGVLFKGLPKDTKIRKGEVFGDAENPPRTVTEFSA